MITRFPGTCACGCRRPFQPGSDVTRAPAGWVLTTCLRVATPAAAPAQFQAGPAEILEILAQARAVAARVAKATSPTLPPGSSRGPRSAAVEDAGRAF